MMRRHILTTLLVAACAASLLAQESPHPADEGQETPAPTPTFAAEVEQVIVDLVVSDKKDQPVAGFSRDDFVLTEDGQRQSITSFEAIELPEQPAAEAPPPPIISVNTSPEAQRGRTFVIVFDDTHITPYRARDAKAAVASFLENGVREGDYVTLISTSGGTWWTSRMNAGRDELIDTVKTFDGRYIPDNSMERLSDWEAMRIYEYRDPQVANQVYRRYQSFGVVMQPTSGSNSSTLGTAEDPFVSSRASDVYFQARNRLRATLDALERAANGLAGARGRKSIILISEGFIYDPNVDDFKRVAQACRRANVAIYFVNARGLEAMPTYMTAEFGPSLPDQDIGFAFAETHEAVAGSDNLASDSGGFTVRNTNDLESGVQRIADEMRIYYLLGYVPTNTARDGRFREIKVEFAKGKGKGLKIRARKGYYAPTPEGSHVADDAAPGVDPVLQAVVDSPWADAGIPLRMTDYVGAEKMLGKAEVLVVTEVDVRGLHFKEVDGRETTTLEFLLVVAHRQSGEYFRYDQTINMKLRPSTLERLSRIWFPIVRDFELQPGDHQAKMVIREASTGVVGSVIHEFKVPPLGEFRVSTPVLTDVHRPNTEGPGVKTQLIARRDFPEGSDLVCSFEVFGAARDAAGMPRVVQGYKVERSDGVVLSSGPESEIQPTSLGALSRLIGFPLRNARPGDYEMELSFRDEVSGKTLELKEPFRVVPAEPAETSEGSAASQS